MVEITATEDYYPAIKMNEVLICALTWMNLESKWNKPATKEQQYGSTYMKYLEQASSYRQKVDSRFPGVTERGVGSYCLTGTEFLFGWWKNFGNK